LSPDRAAADPAEGGTGEGLGAHRRYSSVLARWSVLGVYLRRYIGTTPKGLVPSTDDWYWYSAVLCTDCTDSTDAIIRHLRQR
jgi:hypothetical protein